MAKKIIIKQVRSTIKRLGTQKRTMEALGLHKMNQEVEHEATASILGMVNKVQHLVTVTDK